MPSILLLAALLAAEPPPRPTGGVGTPPASRPSSGTPATAARAQSLATIARAMAIQTIAMQAMLGPVESEARKFMASQADLKKLEAQYPGVSDVLLKSIIDDFRARLTKLDATIEADVETHFGAKLSDGTLEHLALLAAIIARSFDDKLAAIAQASDVEAAKRVDIAKPSPAELHPIFEALRRDPGGKAAVEELFRIQTNYAAMQDRALATMYCETLDPAAKAVIAFLKARGAPESVIAPAARDLAEASNKQAECRSGAATQPALTDRPG